jgi:hypothetical protein
MQAPDPYAKWLALKVLPATSGDALEAFKEMALSEAGPWTNRPSRAALNPKAPKAMPARMFFDLAEPDGRQDHFLYKDEDDLGKRLYAGWRRPQDYKPERAERILFIPEVIRSPQWVYEEKDKPNNWIYACQTALDEYFIVVVDVTWSGRTPNLEFLSAYPVKAKRWGAKEKRWRKIFSR